MPLAVVSFDVKDIGRQMPRRRFQRGTLRVSVPAHGGNPERKLPRHYIEFANEFYASSLADSAR